MAAGTFTVTVTGTSGTVKSTAALTLTLVVPTFTLAAAPNTVSVAWGSSGGSTLTVNPGSEFNSTVSLTVTGLPKGVSASFSPATTTASSTLTFVASATAVAATANVTVTGAAGSAKSTASITLTITNPNFTLSASPAGVSVMPGTSGTSTLTITPQSGFSNTVTLTASGLPKGVTASFSPASTTGTSSVTFSAASTVAAGTTTVTITGSSGALIHTAPISLVIVVPNFTLSAYSASVGLQQGGTAITNLVVGPSNGFSNNVNLAVSGLPKGVTASFNPASTSGNSILTLTASASATAGTATLTVTGTSGTLSHAASISLTVLAQSAGAMVVNMAYAYNVYGIVSDGALFTTGGLDGVGDAYSATLLGGAKSVGGTAFFFGPPNVANAVSGQPVALAAGQFSKLKLLATAVNANQPAQTFTVTYLDGTTSTFTQSLSAWSTPQNFPGETKAVTMAYRDTSKGAKGSGSFHLYEYTFAFTGGEQAAGITLPDNPNVVVLAMTLVP